MVSINDKWEKFIAEETGIDAETLAIAREIAGELNQRSDTKVNYEQMDKVLDAYNLLKELKGKQQVPEHCDLEFHLDKRCPNAAVSLTVPDIEWYKGDVIEIDDLLDDHIASSWEIIPTNDERIRITINVPNVFV